MPPPSQYYGDDDDVSDTDKSISFAEKKYKHKYNAQFGHDEPKDYRITGFGLDSDVVSAKKVLAETEKKYGKFTPVQDEYGVW